MADSIKITSLTPLEGDLHDDDQFLVVDVSNTDGDNASLTGKTSRVSVSKLSEKLGVKGDTGEKGNQGDMGEVPRFEYDSSTGVLNIIS